MKNKEDILSFIEEVPHGVYSMMKEYPDIVECSNNLAIFEIKDDVLKVTISLRSSNPETFDAHTEDVSKVYEKYGFEVKKEDYYKPWAFAKDSDLRNLALETYKDLFGKRNESGSSPCSIGTSSVYRHIPRHGNDLHRTYYERRSQS